MGRDDMNEMNNFGLTEKEQDMNLHDYNHALFQNMMFFMDIAWEINMLTGTAVILQDRNEPEKSGTESSYREAYQDYLENRIDESERPVFEQYLEPGNLKKLDREVSFEVRLRRRDGGRDMHRFVLTPVFDHYDKLCCVYLGARNMQTETQQAEARQQEALREAYEAANRANSAKSEFLTQISHDIRTPLNAIIGMTAIAEKHSDNTARVAECLKKISVSSKYLLSLVDEMLDMGMIESGKMTLQEEEVELPELFENFNVILGSYVRERGHEFSMKILYLEHEKVLGDRRRIDQIIMNLVENAAKYTLEDGSVSLTLEEKPTNKQDIGCYEIVVEDNGIGMEPEFVEHLFEPFARAKDRRVEKVQGSGLGLAITNNIVRMMNGNIYVKSTPDKGTKVIVKIFLKLMEEESVVFPQLADSTVLVASSNEALCKAACDTMAGLGIRSEWVLTDREALEQIAGRREEEDGYCAVLLERGIVEDAALVELIREIHSLTGGSTAVVVISEADWSDIEMEARKAGAAGFITRPDSKSRLIHLFRIIIGEQSEDEKSPIQSLTERDFSGYRVLMVEDNESNADIIREILEMVGLKIEQAWNGKEAIEKLAAAEDWYYNIIFMDIQMPVMGGYEAVKAIRSMDRPYAKEVPILAMSANAFAEDVQASLAAGMNEHISKPVDLKKLERSLCRWLTPQNGEREDA
ncbi:MAG: response regulator [Firmicutes bacterium]|nr:response regulator [Bacillota bacterium]